MTDAALGAARGGLSRHEITYGSGQTSQRQARLSCQDPVTPPHGRRGGIAQLVTPRPALGAIVGRAPLSRAELTTRVWASIKAHELQDAQARRHMHADATLHKVLGRDQVSMFELPKLLTQHVTAARQ